MSENQFYRNRLSEHLDENGDLVPPWERFPNYERYTIGWRMGSGEDWLHLWHDFLGHFDPAFEIRLAYLRRHPPAPVTWADRVYDVLHPSQDETEGDDNEAEAQITAQRRAELLHTGLIASDASYPIWLSQQEGVDWPWANGETPETTARHWTRDLWFWSRQVADLRRGHAWAPPEVPESWQPCFEPLATGKVPALDLRQGLLSLAQMLSAGQVLPPWQLGLSSNDFADSFEMDMGYADAFRLWVMSAFDDHEHLRRYLDPTEVPKNWDGWIAEQFDFD